MRSTQSGFTLIELVIVIILLGILGATISPRFINTQDNARLAVVEAAVGAVQSAALIQFAANNGVGVVPATIIGGTDGVGNNGDCGVVAGVEVQFTAALACVAGADTAFTLEHCDDLAIEASGVIPADLCI